jgi:uncharacterized protein
MNTVLKAFTFGAGLAMAAVAAQAQVVTLGTNEQGSVSFIAGAAVARVATQQTPLVVRSQALTGSTSFIPMLSRGEVTFGFSNATEFNWAYSGTGTFDGRPHPNLRYVGMVFPIYAGFAVTADLGMTELSDLLGRRGTGLRITSEYPSLRTIHTYLETGLHAVGADWSDFTTVPVGGLAQGMEALGEGRTDVTWIPLGAPASRAAYAALSNRGGWRFLSMDVPGAAEAYGTAFPGSFFVELHDPTQPWLAEPVSLQMLPFMMATSAEAPEDAVYHMTRAIIENQATLADIMPNFRNLIVAEMARPGGLPYHPGAIRAYQEAGIAVNL